MLFNKLLKNKGFTLVETLVGIAVFLVISTAAYQAYVSLFSIISQNQFKILALNLANEQFEIIRNLSYSSVGIPGSIPNGIIPHIQSLTRGNILFTVTTTIRNVDQPADGTLGGSPNDLSPADNKLVEVQIDCATCKNFQPVTLTTTIAPKGLETSSNNGALFIKVFDANGVAVPNASVHVVNTQITPNITIDDVTDSNGFLQIVDAPTSTSAYQITVSKTGYSTDKTYTPGASNNPNPYKPHATVVLQQVTQISFSIDKISPITISTLNNTCASIPNFNMSFVGSKEIGPGVPKLSANISTNSSGLYASSSIEWDIYSIVGLNSSYDVAGVNPLNPIAINPNSSQNIQVILTPKESNALLISVKDSSNQLPIANAIVTVTGPSSYSSTKTTGIGSINQTDWSTNGSYNTDDGNVNVTSPVGDIKLKNAFGSYNPSGWLESLTYDTGSASNFHNLIWLPTDSPASTSVKLQIATATTSTATTTWNYLGTDGTDLSYYTVSNASINTVHNGDRYLRYRVFLGSQSTSTTPNISDIGFTFTSDCVPPGQVLFQNLSNGAYHVVVSKSGYSDASMDITVSSSWQSQDIILAP
jgi:prepilin-type N-terminal cleavage/methylation domain-containing protein